MKVIFEKVDLKKCFEFAVKYHLAEGKSNFNRTTGQYRGLGSIINDFFYGKLIEAGTAKAIEELNPGIKVNLDFELHKMTPSDPDIISVTEKGKDRRPKIYTEIKNVSEGDRWVGLTQEQMKTIKTSPLVKKDCSNVYLIYATIKRSKDKGDADLLGIYLKEELKTNLLSEFCEISDIYMEFQYLLTGKELIENGTEFNEGSYFYETDIATEEFSVDERRIVLNSGFKIIRGTNGKFPIIMENQMEQPEEFGDIICKGDYELYIKENRKSNRVYINCLSDVSICNKVLGEFIFKQGKMHQLRFNTIGRDPVLKRNNIWIAQRNLKNIIKESTEDRLKRIAKEI